MRRIRDALVLLLLTIVLLEVVLQVLGLAFWLFAPRVDTDAAVGSSTVLCVGDSYTYGLGTSSLDFAYPRQLEPLLHDRLGPEWRVVNGGWPGQDSRHVLELLDEQLAEHRPAAVCVLVGVNDQWSQPEELVATEVSAAAAERGFRWELRTLRFARIFASMFTASTPDPGSVKSAPRAGLPGAYRTASALRLVLDRGGTGELIGRPFRWVAEGDSLRLGFEDGTVVMARYTVDERALELEFYGPNTPSMAIHGVDQAPTMRLVRDAGGTSSASDDSFGPAYISHLRQICERVLAHGADVLLVEYPHHERLAPYVASVARERPAITHVPTAGAFRRRLDEQPGVDLFAADGHCNDAGYALIAEAVAAALGSRLQARDG